MENHSSEPVFITKLKDWKQLYRSGFEDNRHAGPSVDVLCPPIINTQAKNREFFATAE